MKTLIHILTDRVAPFHNGGLENSVNRISKLLCKSNPDVSVIIYVTSKINDATYSISKNIEIIPLFSQIIKLSSPLLDKKINIAAQYRIEYYALRNAFLQRYDTNSKNILVSFYLTSKGLLFQYLSDDFEIPHIALIRGTDFAKDLFNPQRFNIFEYVIKNADYIICTNRSQEKKLIKLSPDNKHKIDVIYNSLDENSLSLKWTKPNSEVISFFSDTGYSFKKGTHILISAMIRIIEEHNLPIKLIIAGSSDIDENEYWENYCQEIEKKYPSNFAFLNFIEDVNPYILDAHYYCSATLSEGCSNSRLIALASGIPIITTRTGEIIDFEDNLTQCALAEPGDYDGFYNIILQMLNKDAVDYNLLNDQREFVQKNFNEQVELAKWKGLLEKIK